ncbi:unnamed protein product [Bursaphelenchus xylophilus]|uniref:Enoyl-[acyl-carrier-protein] reductase, mitochondrial n=1 Tax=Bursaphelenchus xylophilus TaxID=6326 RepID=A0A1I7RJ56_BURXY|nr:unnamed protein product [Bursaphelenchus xylophilus]CAG9119373.1 unnamed protein product [Bursaphelenchus xylophilus]
MIVTKNRQEERGGKEMSLGKVINSRAIKFFSIGNPRKSLKLVTEQIDTSLKSGEILTRWIASPVHPADINIANGVYFYKREPPSCLGIDAFGIVEKVATDVKYVQPSDHIIPIVPQTQGGFWREFQVLKADEVFKIKKELPLEAKVILAANATSAYLVLTQFVKLEKGDYVLQNAANSQFGRMVTQTAKALGFKSINVMRERADYDAVKDDLLKHGADYVFTEEEFKKTGRDFVKSLDRPLKLSINGVGGKCSILMSANLTKFGTMVVYGGMSLKPHEVLTSSLVFNSIRVIGFLLYDFINQENVEFTRKIYGEVQDLFLSGKISAPPMDKVQFEDFMVAIERTLAGGQRKQLLMIGKEDRPQL